MSHAKSVLLMLGRVAVEEAALALQRQALLVHHNGDNESLDLHIDCILLTDSFGFDGALQA